MTSSQSFDGSSDSMPGNAKSNTGPFFPHATALNVIPSRQNIFLPEHDHCSETSKTWWPWEGIYSTGTQPAESLVSPKQSPTKRPLLQSIDDKNEKEVSDSQDEHALTFMESVFNLANTVLGVGVLSVPYAFKLSGYVSILLILVTILITSQTGVFIGSALVLAGRSRAAAGVPKKGRDFAFLAHVAFGSKGRVLIGAVTSLEIWFALVTFMVMNGVNVALVTDVSSPVASTVSCLLAAPMVFLPMRITSYLSLVASAALAVAAGALVCAALTMQDWANPYDHIGSPALMQLRNIPRSVGIIVFCFAGHPCFPVVHECMKDRAGWRLSVYFTFFLAFLYYGGLGVFGYLVFGTDLQASVTKNLELVPQARLFRHISAWAFVVKIQLTAPLLLNAIIVSIWAPEGKQEWPLKRMLLFIALTLATALVAVAFSRDVAVVAALTGSLFTMTTSVLFPAAVHLRLAQRYSDDTTSISCIDYLPHMLVLSFGIFMAVAGTYLSVCDIMLSK